MLPILKRPLWNIQTCCRDFEINFLKIYWKETYNKQEEKQPGISKFS